ncbi:MAG: aminotransferase class V-fold PLP-dependent enzyme [Armatimonadetes bacterium]|nr:aminotransferase class V-fold PLP-dependent enzyme [Armatimonadota bacterium]
MPLSRRDLFVGAFAAAAFKDHTLDLVANVVAKYGSNTDAQDEDFWAQIQEAFTLDRNTANFNNGGCSPSPRIVQETLRRQLEFSNQAPSNYMWRVLEPEIESVRQRLARVFACDPEEMAITRNASESLEILILGLGLQAGDEVLTTIIDYPRMITTIQQRERRDGVKMVQVKVPTPAKTAEDLIAPIRNGITDKTRMMVISQVSFMNGQIFPIREIVKLAKSHGIPVVVDGAHAFVQFEFNNKDLDCEFYGTSLHKWLMAPIGTGFLYVRKNRIPDVWPLMAAGKTQDSDIRKFEEIGTHPAANHNAIGEALTFHEMIGMKRKEARLRYLRHRWTDRLQDFKNVHFYTNLDPKQSCALTTVGIQGVKTGDLAGWLLTKHGIFVTAIVNDFIDGIRVSPNVYSTIEEIDRFADAMVLAATKGIA